LLLLAEGRVVNVVAAEGHPPEVMDLAFGIEALALAWLAQNAEKLSADVHPVPPELDAEAARLVLAVLGAQIDVLTPAQRAYLASWRIGSLFPEGAARRRWVMGGLPTLTFHTFCKLFILSIQIKAVIDAYAGHIVERKVYREDEKYAKIANALAFGAEGAGYSRQNPAMSNLPDSWPFPRSLFRGVLAVDPNAVGLASSPGRGLPGRLTPERGGSPGGKGAIGASRAGQRRHRPASSGYGRVTYGTFCWKIGMLVVNSPRGLGGAV
jgi:hypothetical protein